MLTTKSTLALIGATAVTALAAPTAYAEGVLHPTTGKVPRVLDAPKAPLTIAKAKAAQERAARSGRFPRAPRLATKLGLQRADEHGNDHSRRLAQQGPAERIPMDSGRPVGELPKLFGYQGTFAEKRWPLVQWVNYVFATVVPTIGGHFRQPAVYEVGANGYAPDGCGPVANARFCWGGRNTMVMSVPFMQSVFDGFGDAAFASVAAHEYGHGAMAWLGFTGRGWFQYQLYREGFADCMAGAWLYWMHYNRYTDSVGRGDGQELIDIMSAIGSAITTVDNHGDARWRTALATYGWNYGFSGCASWGRQLANA
jgi:hypothetical protein